MSFFGNEKFWRVLAYFWTALFLGFILINFYSQGTFEYLVPPFSAIYTAVLGLYVGTKEFNRWHYHHSGRHPGELFILAWTAAILTLFIESFRRGASYHISSEIVAVYIVVLSLFALTQKSKNLYKSKKKVVKRKKGSK